VVNVRRIEVDRFMNSGNGILMLGILWLIFWLAPAFFLFQDDPRWGHNFAIPILFIIVGLAYNTKKISCQLVAVIASYITIPTFLGFWAWDTATIISSIFAIVLLIFYIIERYRKTELINPNQRLKAWLKIHSMTFAYIGLVHMPLIFFLVRWFNPEPFLNFLPIEHHVSTSTFNVMLFVLTIFAIIERNVKKIGRFNIPKAGFIWSILMIIIPIIAINILGE
jgi:hypothetical protein